ncbi:rod shape-determining protein MreD [Shivajiella indica]|uniref:Rod shape-determining protein MreD n=1 Tax=Shivajiella indica TaxID=872115 RepID=A0ABW5BE15_9BACT
MTSNRVLLLVGGFILYLIVQVVLLKNMVVFGTSFCFLYVFFILLLPIEMKTIPVMLISFAMGMGVDLFYDTIGIHTASLVATAFIRNTWLNILTPTGGYDENLNPSLLNMGMGWYVTYSLPLILLHHTLFFFIESLGTNLFLPVVQKIIGSAIFAFLMSIIVQLLFYRRRRGI